MNKQKTLLVLILLIAIVVSALLVIKQDNKINSPREELVEELEQRPEETLNLKHQYKDSEHVFVGQINLPTPCHSYNAVILDKEYPEIQISIMEPKEETSCIQVITEKSFKVSYKSNDPDLKFDASINGKKVNLNIFEISPNDDIDTVELFLKG